MHISRKTILTIAASFSFIFSSNLIEAKPVYIYTNQATLLKLDQPADTIIIGNPLIADATVQKSNTIVLTGKGFGVTNLLVLKANGEKILDTSVIVARETALSVRVYRQSNIQTLSCTPICEGAYRNDAEKDSDMILSKQ